MSLSPPPRAHESKLTAGEPTVAVLLTWFVPGAGHLYLGRPAFALAAFALVDGLYFLGLRLSDWMGFEYLQKELQAPFAAALAPEVGNLGAFLMQMKVHGFGYGFPRAWPEWMSVGVVLTALAGVLNVCLMVQAHLDARRPRSSASAPIAWRRSPALACFLAWLVPGLGHVQQGRRLRGAMIFLLLGGLLVLGTVLAEGSNLSRERHFYYWGGQFMAGLPALVLELVHDARPVTKYISYGEAGLVMGAIAGLLNVLAMLDVYGYGEAAYLHPESAGSQPQKAAARASGELESAT